MIKTDQKYYHFVVIKEKKENGIISCIDYLKNLSDQKREPINSRNFPKLNHFSFVTNIQYSTSGVTDFSILENKLPPYRYDVVYYNVEEKAVNLLILVFPFSKFAKDMIEKLRVEHGLLRTCSFSAVDIPRAISLNMEDQYTSKYLTKTRISNIEVTLKGEVNLSSIRMTGDNPLKSLTYKALLETKQKIESSNNLEQSKAEINNGKRNTIYENKKIVLACELISDKGKSFGAKIHVDTFGNFKFYLHQNGINFRILPNLLKELLYLECLHETSINPLLRDTPSSDIL